MLQDLLILSYLLDIIGSRSECFALSDIMTERNPFQPTKCQNGCRNECAERVLVSSKCTAQVDAQADKQMYSITLSLDSAVTCDLT